MISLTINGDNADLPNGFAPTLQNIFLDLVNPVKKYNTISYSITLPFTANNNRIFGNISNPNSIGKFSNLKSEERSFNERYEPPAYKCNLIINDNEVFSGFFYLDSISDGYSGNIAESNNKIWINKIKDQQGNELSINELSDVNPTLWQEAVNDQVYGEGEFDLNTNIWAQQMQTMNPTFNNYSGPVYPYIQYYHKNYEFFEENINWIMGAAHTFEDLRPAIYIKDILKCIAYHTDYTLNFSNKVAETIQDKIIPYTGEDDYFWGLGTGNPLAWVKAEGVPTFSVPDIVIENTARLANAVATNLITYYCNYTGILKIQLQASVWEDGETTEEYKGGRLGTMDASINNFLVLTNQQFFAGDGFINTIYYNVTKGERLVVIADGLAGSTAFDFFEICYVTENQNPCLSLEEYKDWGAYTPYIYNLPKIKITDFIKSVCLMFGCLMYIDQDNQILNFVDIEQLLNETKINNEYIKLQVLNKSYKLNTLNQFTIDYSLDTNDINPLCKPVNTVTSIPFANTFYRDWTFIKPITDFDDPIGNQIQINIPTLFNKDTFNKDRLSIDWEIYANYPFWDTGITYEPGDLVLYDFTYIWPGPSMGFLYNTFKGWKCIATNIDLPPDPTDPLAMLAWEVSEDYLIYDNTYFFNFLPRILKIQDTPYNNNPVVGNPEGNIYFKTAYQEWNGTIFSTDIVYTFLPVVRTENFDTEDLNSFNNAWEFFRPIFSPLSNIIEFETYITQTYWNNFKKGIPLVIVEDSLHLITEITQWNTLTNRAKCKAIKWTI